MAALRGTLALGLWLVASCSSPDPDDDAPEPFQCEDADGDGYGRGPSCLGYDCAEGYAALHECDCAPGRVAEGCACGGAQPEVCFDGPAEVVGVASCVSGLRRCENGFWSRCDGQVAPRAEWCNGEDDDCDGAVDQGLVGCRWCGSECDVVGWGDGLLPFGEVGPLGGGLEVSEEGDLTVTGVSSGARIAWIPSTLAGTISKIDTTTFAELGRYRTGPLGRALGLDTGPGDVPVAVAVAPSGDAIVVNRAPTGVPTATRIRHEDCPPGEDGVTDTSSGADVLPWDADGPRDECIAWNAAFSAAGSSGRVVLLEVRPELDGRASEWVWAGSDEHLAELDGETGEPTGVVRDLPITPVAAALDGQGGLWVLGPGAHEVVRVDGATGDLEVVPLPLGEDASAVWIDERGDVWTSGSHVLRYREGDLEWDVADGSGATDGGLVVDGAGVAWATSTSGVVQRVEVMAGQLLAEEIDSGAGGTGIAIDHDGFVWVVSFVGGVERIDPAQRREPPTPCCDFLEASFVRGDLTGAPRFDGLDVVVWTGRLEFPWTGCPTTWGEIDIRGTSLEGTRLGLAARASLDSAELPGQLWVPIAEVPPDTLPVRIGERLDAAGQQGGALEIRIEIDPVDIDELPVIEEITVERSEWCF